MEEAWNAPASYLQKIGLGEEITEEIIARRPLINPNQEWEKLEKEGIQVITIQDKDYSSLLKEIYDPPALLYYKGSFSKKDSFSLGVVGTRKASPYGLEVTPPIVRDLVRSGLVIVSGLALGIDALAHETTVKEGGRTIAVLGSGLDQQSIYPSPNRYLAQKIIESDGLIITEYPVGTLPLKQNFPARNRIISGLCLGTLVIEAPETSGALITARDALEQNREVFAVPGSIYNPFSVGPNELIKKGAKLVNSAQDILETLNLQTSFLPEKKEIKPDSEEEAKLLKILSGEPIHIDELVQKSNLETARVSSVLTMMEIKGKVRNLGNMNYVLAR